MGLTLLAEPRAALVDEPLALTAPGAAPGSQLTLRACTVDGAGRAWTSAAKFEADAAGRVDPSRVAPVGGSYSGIDPSGLLWSLAPPAGCEPIPFVKEDVEPFEVAISCELGGAQVAELTLQRLFVAPGVERIPVRERGIVGTFFRPQRLEPGPAVLVLGGSDGGLKEHQAAVLASRGFASLALAYFFFAEAGGEHLPARLARVPLEYFETALAWLAEQKSVDAARIAALGTSRGGELALLLGASFASVRAVIGYAASGVLHAGLGEPGKAPPAAWTRAGEPLPFVPMDPTAVDWRPPIRLAPGFSAGLRDAAAVARAEIALERARGPVLLFSGEDDAMWPAAELAEIAVRRLARHPFPHAIEHRVYAGAGHGIRLPGLPTSLTRMLHPVTGQVYELGGVPEANARASRDAWARVLAFLAALQEE